MKGPLQYSHTFLAEILTKHSQVLDGTMGNGHDTLFLAQRAQKVYAFDIQEAAVARTKDRLEQAGLTNVQLILDSHENLDAYVRRLDAAIFNLGYLPSADKSLMTKPDSTIVALKKTLHCLVPGGRVAIMVYYGHQGGVEERDAVLDFVATLEQRSYTVMLYKPLNQVNQPPFLIMIEKH
ncbi:tRNA (mnm(5)s(2)U34)-methyltransferase [Streptococcus halichoeri]|uniref:tRNA (mnm(5)s(2)U34)-methyltransferase n=1 Tax=Streptococcus halichoeri TaxID=254785 RepID=UPI00135C6EE4|nr:class I SAM-dependent methyltransferase [Streptococcus halichoeri]